MLLPPRALGAPPSLLQRFLRVYADPVYPNPFRAAGSELVY